MSEINEIEHLRQWLAANERSASYAARALGVSASTVWTWLNGTRNPSGDARAKITALVAR